MFALYTFLLFRSIYGLGYSMGSANAKYLGKTGYQWYKQDQEDDIILYNYELRYHQAEGQITVLEKK